MSRSFVRIRCHAATAPMRVFAILGVVILVLTGCSERSDDKPKAVAAPVEASAPASASPTNRMSLAEVFPGATTNELAHIKACQDALDDDRNSLAMRHARELMDSTNVAIRLHAVETFGWIGKMAIRELAEMMTDSVEEVADEALRQWEMAFDEFSSEIVKMEEIVRAAQSLKNQHSIETVMMKLTGLEDYNAVKALSNIITSTNVNPIAVEVARSEYVSLTEEVFVNAERARVVANLFRARANGVSPETPEGKASVGVPSVNVKKKGMK